MPDLDRLQIWVTLQIKAPVHFHFQYKFSHIYDLIQVCKTSWDLWKALNKNELIVADARSHMAEEILWKSGQLAKEWHYTDTDSDLIWYKFSHMFDLIQIICV